MVKTKICTKCGIEYLATNEFFHKNSSTKDGLKTSCKICENKRSMEYDRRRARKERPNIKPTRKQMQEKAKKSAEEARKERIAAYGRTKK